MTNNVKTLLSYNKIQVELGLISYIEFNRKFVDVPLDAIYNPAIRKVYMEFKNQFNTTGAIEPGTLSERAQETLMDAADIYHPHVPQPIVDALMDAYNVRRFAYAVVSQIVNIESNLDTVKITDEISKTVSDLSKLVVRSGKDTYKHDRSATNFFLNVQSAASEDKKMCGIASNIQKLDELLNGWQAGKTYILGGMEKLGKSRFCCELSNQWLLNGHGGIWFSMEMGEDDIHECHLSNRCAIDTADFGTNKINKSRLIDLNNEISERYMNDPLHIDTTSSVSPEQIRTVIGEVRTKLAKENKPLTWVVVDYIQRMVDGYDKAAKLEDVAKALADIARDEQVIMVVISQLSQAAERNQGEMSPHQFIKGSKGIREAADAIIVLHKVEGQTTFDGGVTQYMNAYLVQRKGASNIDVPLISQLQYSRFRNL